MSGLSEPFWTYPAPLNTTFRNAQYQESFGHNGSYSKNGIETILLAAVQNLSLSERTTDGFDDGGFGHQPNGVVRVGDVFEFEWKGTENHTVALNCVVCSTGPGEDGNIERACANYTDSPHISPRNDIPNAAAPGHPYVFPSLEQYFALPNETCGLCIFTLYSMLGYVTSDYSVPFPVLQAPSKPHKLFNAANPSGSPDASIAILGDPTPVSSDKPNVGMIVGVVLGVLGGAALIALLSWCLWRRRRAARPKKVVQSPTSSTESPSGNRNGDHVAIPANTGTQDIALQRLQRIQPVVRRPDTSASEVPPPYHEAIRTPNPGNPS